jgi:hypothetical protein
MRLLTVAALTFAVLAACGRSNVQLLDEGGLESIRGELDIQTCLIRIDSVGFEIGGILYHAAADGDDRPLKELLPDTLPVCPTSGEDYIITETQSEVIITCPAGHGSVTLQK